MKAKFIIHGYGIGMNDLISTMIDGEKGYKFPETGYEADLYLIEQEDGQKFPIIRRMNNNDGNLCIGFETRIEGNGKYEWKSIDLVRLRENEEIVLIDTPNNKMSHPGYKGIDTRIG